MPRYAQFDPSVSPSPVTGWYDTTILHYPNLPDESVLIEMTDTEWALHFASPSGWHVIDGRLAPPAES